MTLLQARPAPTRARPTNQTDALQASEAGGSSAQADAGSQPMRPKERVRRRQLKVMCGMTKRAAEGER